MKGTDLIGRLQRQEEGSLDDLLLHHGPLLRYVIAPIVQDAQEREDCLSEVLMTIWQRSGQYNTQLGSWEAWLTAVARNAALNHRRRLARHQGAEELPEDMPATEPGPEELLLQKERQEALLRALERLPGRDRLLFYRKYYYQQSTAQIAAELSLTERAVEGRLYRLKKTLRKNLGGEYDV